MIEDYLLSGLVFAGAALELIEPLLDEVDAQGGDRNVPIQHRRDAGDAGGDSGEFAGARPCGRVIRDSF